MAGEKAKENPTLQAACAACDKEMSVELLRGLTVGSGRDRQIVAVCSSCLDSGWSPDAADDASQDAADDASQDAADDAPGDGAEATAES